MRKSTPDKSLIDADYGDLSDPRNFAVAIAHGILFTVAMVTLVWLMLSF